MSHQIAERTTPQWVYTTIRVHDAERVLLPTHVSSNHLLFQTPPRLASQRILIVISNGNDEYRTHAEVLPHDGEAIDIPIRVDQEVKRTA